jgi:hypothetical protein
VRDAADAARGVRLPDFQHPELQMIEVGKPLRQADIL